MTLESVIVCVLFVLSVIYAECHKEPRYAESRYAKCRYAECCGSFLIQNFIMELFMVPQHSA